MADKKPAVVLLSGGLDSSTTLAIARSLGFECYALSFNYGQRHNIELNAAAEIGRALGVKEHRVVAIDTRAVAGSALTSDLTVPKGRQAAQMDAGIPITYVPARNTIFLSYALAWAETLGSTDIFIGVNAVDYSGYPDCRPDFVRAFEQLANVATKAGVEGATLRVHAPLIHCSKAEIIGKAVELKVDLSLTHSCYDPLPDGEACGQCDSCQLRRQGFREAGLPDPVRYAF